MPIKIDFVGSSLTDCMLVRGTFSCIKIDWRKARERELATLNENRRAVGMLKPMRDKNKGTHRGGRRDDTCDHGLSRRSQRVKPPTS